MKLTEKIGYGFGDMSSSMFWKLFSYFLPFFYSNVFGLSLADAGVLMLVHISFSLLCLSLSAESFFSQLLRQARQSGHM